jgi:hypothetical protein
MQRHNKNDVAGDLLTSSRDHHMTDMGAVRSGECGALQPTHTPPS